MSTPPEFTFEANPARIVFGAGSLARLPEEADRLGAARVLVICSPGRRAIGDEAAALLGGRAAGVCDAAAENIPEGAFDRAMADIERLGADGVAVIGGGSPIGLGKAVVAATGLVHIAVPTTYSGSELMADWRVETPGSARRGVDLRARPATVIYDPLLTLDLPPGVSGPSGMNAMAHAVESLYHPNANPVSSAMAEEGIGALARSLPVVVREPGDVDARSEALRGAWLAGGFRAGSCLEHRIAQSLRRLFHVTHADSHAVVLPYVVAFNEPAAPGAMRRIARALDAESASAGLFRLNDALGIKRGLRDLGMAETDLDTAADIIADGEFVNPRPAGRDDIRALIDDAFHARRQVL